MTEIEQLKQRIAALELNNIQLRSRVSECNGAIKILYRDKPTKMVEICNEILNINEVVMLSSGNEELLLLQDVRNRIKRITGKSHMHVTTPVSGECYLCSLETIIIALESMFPYVAEKVTTEETSAT